MSAEGNAAGPYRREDYLLDLTRPYHNLTGIEKEGSRQSFHYDNSVAAMEENGHFHYYLSDELIQAGIPSPYTSQGEAQPFGYTCYRYDDISGIYFAKAREYKPETGRFLAEDLIKGNGLLPQTLNPYVYCWNSPLMFVDLDGLLPSREDAENFIDNITDKLNKTVTYGIDISGTWEVSASSTPSAAVTIYKTKTNAQEVEDLNESGGCIGGTITAPIMEYQFV